MPIIKSAQKRVRQTAVRTARNRRVKRAFKAAARALEEAVAAKKPSQAKKSLAVLQSVVDKMQKKNIIHKNKAARIKSRYVRLAKQVSGKKVRAVKKAKPQKKAA